jgi:hypothetical protein
MPGRPVQLTGLQAVMNIAVKRQHRLLYAFRLVIPSICQAW